MYKAATLFDKADRTDYSSMLIYLVLEVSRGSVTSKENNGTRFLRQGLGLK